MQQAARRGQREGRFDTGGRVCFARRMSSAATLDPDREDWPAACTFESSPGPAYGSVHLVANSGARGLNTAVSSEFGQFIP